MNPKILDAYLVLSVKDLRRALRAAEASRKACGADINHCVLFDKLAVCRTGDTNQISSVDFMTQVDSIENAAEIRAELNK